MIKAVIFDFDGVILNSSRKGRERIINIVRELGYPVRKDVRQILKSSWGSHGTKLIENCFGLNPSIATVIYRKLEYRDITKPFPLIRDAKETLNFLRSEMNLKTGLLTSRHKKNTIDVLIHFDLIELFDVIQAKNDWTFVKPDPHAFCSILDRLFRKWDIAESQCIYMGDTPIDFKAASERGIACINVLTGIFNQKDFLAIGQKKENIIGSIADLPKWLEKYGRA